MNGKNPLRIALCVAVSTASFAQTGKKYPDPAPMTHDMSEFWEPQPRIVTPADMDRAVPPPSERAVVLLETGRRRRARVDRLRWETRRMERRGRRYDRYPELGRPPDSPRFRRLSAAPRMERADGNRRRKSGPGQQRSLHAGALRSADTRQLRQRDIRQRPGRRRTTSSRPRWCNACQKPGKWNTYDIIYTAPRFKDDGTLHSHGRITVLHNGVLIQNNTLILGTTEFIGFPKTVAHGRGPIVLQDHLNPVRFRNIWIREL